MPQQLWPLLGPFLKQPLLLRNAIPCRPAPLGPVIGEGAIRGQEDNASDGQSHCRTRVLHIRSTLIGTSVLRFPQLRSYPERRQSSPARRNVVRKRREGFL